MAENSAIQWCHHTFNPWWGCTKVVHPELGTDAACMYCYAEAWAKRTGHQVWGIRQPRRDLSDNNWSQPEKWNRRAAKVGKRYRVFCASMCDVFEDRADRDPLRERLWKLIDETPNLDWLLLTKRPENIGKQLATRQRDNVWLGTTAVTQPWLNLRAPELLRNKAAVHFLSAEPLMGELDLTPFVRHPFNREPHCPWCEDCIHDGPDKGWQATREDVHGPFLDWVIAGGESGPKARTFDVQWARHLQEQCARSGTAFFLKQLGQRPIQAPSDPKGIARELVVTGKGGDPDEWPEDLRVRQFPEAAA